MRKPWCCLGLLGLFGLAPAWADSLSIGRTELLSERCAAEMSVLHGVWRSPEIFLPLYGDLELVTYLAARGGRDPGIAVLPVFSPEPLSFRSRHVVFLSTGLILKAASAKELAGAIRTAAIEVRTEALPACGALAPRATADLAGLQRRLAAQIAEYERLATRRMQRRDAAQ